MYPGQGRQSYGYLRPGVPPPQANQLQRPSGPPPDQHYHRPAAPPQQYQRPPGPPGPPSGGLQRPRGPPPRPQMSNQQHSQPPAGPNFRYSRCTGRKKLLLVGINYFGTRNQLRGCINDVQNMFNFLVHYFGYLPGDIVVLTDDTRDPKRVPTRLNIIRGMMWLVRDARPDDSLVFHYSGHGGQTKDFDGDEQDGMDDTIYPVDFEMLGMLIDDEMHDIMVKPLVPGVRLTALYDSCHSGTALDLPYIYSTKGLIKEPNMWKDAGSGLMNAAMSYARGDMSGIFKNVNSIISKVSNSGSKTAEQNRIRKFSHADVISISGCKDDQTSADSSFNGVATGAMSWSFITTLQQQPQQSYLMLLNNMRNLLMGKYSQKPQLSSSHPIDMNLQFVM